MKSGNMVECRIRSLPLPVPYQVAALRLPRRLVHYLVLSHRNRNLLVLTALGLLVACAPRATAQRPSLEKLAQLKHAVVIVTTYDDRGNPLLQGSGFFITPERVVTTLHVINHASRIRIETFAGQTVSAISVLASDVNSDLALLQIDEPHRGTTTLQVEYAAPFEGESIFVLSNPLGSYWKTTRGRVGTMWNLSGTGLRLQITASLRPGSSGGPVLNKQGRVIGVAAMHIRSADALDFAVPAHNLKALQASADVSAKVARPSQP